jgi:hypothetical protein
MSYAIYAFADAAKNQQHIRSDEVTWTGTWSGAGTYVAANYDSLIYGNDRYVAIIDNVGVNPTAKLPNKQPNPFAYLSIIQAGDEPPFTPPVAPPDVQYQALVTSWSGTRVANDAYAMAQTGTIVANQAGTDAYNALLAAWEGTVAGTTAIGIANYAVGVANAAAATASNISGMAESALVTSWTGTLLAFEALQTAWDGTATANAVDSKAQNALDTAYAGTAASAAAINLANQALVATQSGTVALAQIAELRPVIYAGTELASDAFQLAATGTALAYDALTTAWTGTSAAAAAINLANDAYAVANTGTASATAAIGLANQALVLAQAGTVLPFLDEIQDVNAPAPTVSQVLAWDGSQWIATDAPSTAAPSTFVYYLQDVSSGTAGYERLLVLPAGGTEEADSVVVSSANGAVYIAGYISEQLNRTRIDAGLWEFNTYVSAYPQPGTVVTDIYLRHINGNETFLFAGTTDAASATYPPQLMTEIRTAGSYDVATTDKVIAKYWALTDQVTPITVAIYHNGTEHYSHLHTPLNTSHNDLAGLQGGQTNEYYHVTANQAAAALNSTAPSAANPFVTYSDPRLATADSAYTLAAAGTASAYTALQTAWAGTQAAGSVAYPALQTAWVGTAAAAAAIDLANVALQTAWTGTDTGGGDGPLALEAFSIACIGTNVGTNALLAAATGSNLAYAAYTQLGTITSSMVSGTTAMQLPVQSVRLPSVSPVRIDTVEQEWRLLAAKGEKGLWQMVMPQDYGSALKARVAFAPAYTQGGTNSTAVIGVSVAAVSVGDATSVAAKTFATINYGTLPMAPSIAAGQLQGASIDIGNNDNLVPGDLLMIKLERGNLAADTLAGDIAIYGAALEYSTNPVAVASTNTAVTVGTIPYSAASAGTLYYNFTGSYYQTTTVSGNLWVSAINMSPGREINVVLIPDGTARTLGYSAFKWFGTNPPSSISNKEIILAFASFDTTIGGVRAASTIQY